jgi:hypothetical protein
VDPLELLIDWLATNPGAPGVLLLCMSSLIGYLIVEAAFTHHIPFK